MTTKTATAADYAATLAARADDAAAAAIEHDAAAREARSEAHSRESAAETARTVATAARAELRDLVRALVNRDEADNSDAPTEPDRGTWTKDVAAYRATFARARVSTASHQRAHAPRARAYGWTYYATDPDGRRGVDIFEAPQGTNDAAKLDAQVSTARAAALEWIAEHTAGAFLRARGIDPATAPDPADLVTIEADAMPRRDYHNGTPYTYFQTELRATFAGADLERFDPWSLPDELRDRISAAVGNGRRLDDPTPGPTEAEASAALAELVPEILAAYLDRLHRRHRDA